VYTEEVFDPGGVSRIHKMRKHIEGREVTDGGDWADDVLVLLLVLVSGCSRSRSSPGTETHKRTQNVKKLILKPKGKDAGAAGPDFGRRGGKGEKTRGS